MTYQHKHTIDVMTTNNGQLLKKWLTNLEKSQNGRLSWQQNKISGVKIDPAWYSCPVSGRRVNIDPGITS